MIQGEILVNQWKSELINVNVFLVLTEVVSELLGRYFFNMFCSVIPVSHSLGVGKHVGSISSSDSNFSPRRQSDMTFVSHLTF